MIGGLTYIRIVDRNETDPQQGTVMQVFADYNEAMSIAKWTSNLQIVANEKPYVYVWNWYGGSGYWNNSAFTALDNHNYPTP